MKTVLVKKVPDEWEYIVSVNGEEIPHIQSVKWIKEQGCLPRLVITLIAVDVKDKVEFIVE